MISSVFLILSLLILFLWSNANANVNVNILHISDIHLDLSYYAGSPSNCLLGKTGLGCCRSNSIPIEPYRNASVWGDFNCDTPLSLWNATLLWIRNTLQVDVIIMTGDIVNHHDLTQSWSQNYNTIKTALTMLHDTFPNTIVIPVLGNHDTFPVDQLVPSVTAPQILSDVCNIWSVWLPPKSLPSCKECGVYSFVILVANVSIRVIALNSLYYDPNNLALLLYPPNYDICGQKSYVQSMMNLARMNKERVWIIGHISPESSECSNDFALFLQDMSVQYADIICGQFFGHSHADEFRLLRNNASVPIQSIFVAPSVVPSGHFPGVRLYQFDGSHVILSDYMQYHLNLTKQIQSETFIGYTETYTFTDYYELPDASSASLIDLSKRMKQDRDVFAKYVYVFEFGKANSTCNSECYKSTMCDINYVTEPDHSICLN